MMKKQAYLFKEIVIFCFLIFLIPSAYGQIDVKNLIASNFLADENVLELNIPHQMTNISFYVAWADMENKQNVILVTSKAGKQIIDLRTNPNWKGQIKVLAISLNGVKGKLTKPTIADEFRIFFNPEMITPRTINFLDGYSLFSIQFRYILYGIFFLFTLIITFLTKIPFYKSCLLGFLVAWVVLDLRNIRNHAFVHSQCVQSDHQISPFNDLPIFMDKVDDSINNAVWSKETLSGVYNSYAQYRLADRPFLKFMKRPAKEGKEKVNVVITNTPKTRPTLVEYNGFYLTKSKK